MADDAAVQEYVLATVVGNDRALGSLEKVTKAAGSDPSSTLSRGASKPTDSLDPPYEPESLLRVLENSNSLRQCVDAYAVNIDGMGHRFEPVIDLDADGAHDAVSDAILIERYSGASAEQQAAAEPPSDEEIAVRIAQLREVFRIEKFRAQTFFDHVCWTESFTSLRRKTRTDIEATGNGYWELARDAKGEISQIWHQPARDMRLLPQVREKIAVDVWVRTSPLRVESRKYMGSFRRFVQLDDRPIFFKEFGDPRLMSSRTGRFFADAAALESVEPGATAATEILHFKVHSPRSAYGVPRWIGTLLEVLGSRQAAEVNYLYFQNKSIPPLVITVSGGRMSETSVQRIRDYIDTEIKGKNNFHKILILEADAATNQMVPGLDSGAKCQIKIEPLTGAQLKDALFQDYDERNLDKVGMTFRLPRLLRGDVRDFNKATAESALQFAETQVFQPERHDFDFIVNLKIMPLVGVTMWSFVSNGLKLQDPTATAAVLKTLYDAGGLRPADVRQLGGELVLGRELAPIDEEWVNQPIELTVSQNKAVVPAATPPGGTPPADEQAVAEQAVKRLVRVRDALVERDRVDAEKRSTAAAADTAAKTVRLSADDMKRLFDIDVLEAE